MIPQQTGKLLIAPFILMPFIENAFKHVSKRNNGSNSICLKIEVQHQQLLFNISNSISEQYNSSREPVACKGLGLKNVQRRLDLLYADKHSLHINKTGDCYAVSLRLLLTTEKTIIQQKTGAELSIA